jgi:hypothetical protein
LLLNHASVLIVSDDTEFARSVVARWQSQRHVPEITVVTSDVWHPRSAAGHQVIIVGPIRAAKAAILSDVEPSSVVAICVADEEKEALALHSKHPQALVMARRDGWTETLLLVACEALRRVEAVSRAQRAERLALDSQGQATLGRYMLELRPSVNNALTSVLGNADLLLLEPGLGSGECREQVHTIHAMALRLNEIMQRFSSLAAEMRASEKESQAETEVAFQRVIGGS